MRDCQAKMKLYQDSNLNTYIHDTIDATELLHGQQEDGHREPRSCFGGKEVHYLAKCQLVCPGSSRVADMVEEVARGRERMGGTITTQ